MLSAHLLFGKITSEMRKFLYFAAYAFLSNQGWCFMRLRIKTTKLTIQIIAWLQVAGGIVGIGVISWLTFNVGDVNGPILFIILFGFAIFIYSIYTGSKLLKEETLRLGVVLSILNYCIQVFQFEILGYGISYSVGTAFMVGYDVDAFKFDFEIISSNFSMAIRSGDNEFKLMLNVVAVFFIIVLFDIWDEITATPTVTEPAPEDVIEDGE